jgi:hypothetical protein
MCVRSFRLLPKGSNRVVRIATHDWQDWRRDPAGAGISEWAIQDSNLGPLPYQRLPDSPTGPVGSQLSLFDGDCRD